MQILHVQAEEFDVKQMVMRLALREETGTPSSTHRDPASMEATTQASQNRRLYIILLFGEAVGQRGLRSFQRCTDDIFCAHHRYADLGCRCGIVT